MHNIRTLLGLDGSSPTGRGVTVALLDTGIDDQHPDLAPAVDGRSKDCTSTDALIDSLHHGTHLAGVIAGRGTAPNGCRGIAPGASILALKVIPSGRLTEEPITVGLQMAVRHKVDVINMSITVVPKDLETGAKLSPPFVWSRDSRVELELREAFDQGILPVLAAGNLGDARSSIAAPGGCESGLTVGATSKGGSIEPWSSRGPYRIDQRLTSNGVRTEGRLEAWFGRSSLVDGPSKPDIVVPGALVRSTHSKNCLQHGCKPEAYVVASGTSVATAVVTGLVACTLEYLRERAPRHANWLRAALLRNMVCKAAARGVAEHIDDYGFGRLSWPALQRICDSVLTDPRARNELLNEDFRRVAGN